MAKDNKYRWEFCPECGYGFPEYLGLKNGSHEFSCGDERCEAYFRVPEGKGNFDKRQGMELSDKVIYLEKCDVCRKMKPVKLKNLRFLCSDCQNR